MTEIERTEPVLEGEVISMLEPPQDFEWGHIEGQPKYNGVFGYVLMSNSDHEVNLPVMEHMMTGNYAGEYTGWDFHGTCWYADELWYCAVSRYHVHRGTISAKTPQALMQAVSAVFGWQ